MLFGFLLGFGWEFGLAFDLTFIGSCWDLLGSWFARGWMLVGFGLNAHWIVMAFLIGFLLDLDCPLI